jgi:AcrR family transcriptional regulator
VNTKTQKAPGTGATPTEQFKTPFWHFWKCDRCAASKEETRTQLLNAAFEEIHQFGFQSASLSRILKRTGVTKGALYHYFPSKTDLGYAVLDEMIREQMMDFWIRPLQQGNPLDVIIQIIEESGELMTMEDIRLGCPLANLSQEMSPVDEGFRERVEAQYSDWRSALSAALKRGQQAGQVITEIDAEATAVMLVASLEGCLATAKNAQSRELLTQCGMSLIQILNTFRQKEGEKT